MVAGKKSSAQRVKGKHVAAVKKASTKPTASASTSSVATIDRRESRERRAEKERRVHSVPVAEDRRVLERRVKVSRRRQIDPTTCERDYTPDEIEFMAALDDYKRRSGRMFPTCSEVLEVLKKLGYEKRPVVEPTPLPAVVMPMTTTESVTTAS